jgi:serine/threonine protein kinase
MIHRDIKPANIMLDAQGRAILMDFGIVKIVDDDLTYTATGAVVGTARYMSPEVIRSETPDERSDIYSLGVTFFEMLSGSPPFNAESAMITLWNTKRSGIPRFCPASMSTFSLILFLRNGLATRRPVPGNYMVDRVHSRGIVSATDQPLLPRCAHWSPIPIIRLFSKAAIVLTCHNYLF